MPDYDNYSGSWMTAFSGNVLAQLAGVAPGAVRVGWLAREDAAAARQYRTTSSSARSLDIDEDLEVFDDPRVSFTRPNGVVLDTELFRSALSRERRRADRFDEFFALVTVTVDETLAPPVVAALTGATRETDVVGWLEPGRVLGVILAEVAKPSDEIARRIDARLRRELARRLGGDAAERLNVCWYMHAAPGADGAAGISEADPILDDIKSTERRRTVLDALKRGLDVVASASLLLLLSPLLLLIAALVKLTSPGPMLFKQSRVGQLAQPFTMLKFRTMQVNNDCALHQKFVTEFIKASAALKDEAGNGVIFKIQQDPRITRIGRLLRKTSLDELPQLWNVLRGDMSLVGPRPPLRYELEQYRSWHWRRVLEAKPGVTGLWQVTGRSRTTFDEMVRLDLRYAKTRSIWTDLWILLATPRAVVSGKGAC